MDMTPVRKAATCEWGDAFQTQNTQDLVGKWKVQKKSELGMVLRISAGGFTVMSFPKIWEEEQACEKKRRKVSF